MKDKYNELKEWFNNYVSKFKMQNKEDQDNIELKINHSKRVTNEMENIIEAFELSEEQRYMAKIIALFHDIGRFRQYEKHQTFSDYKSEDHGDLGVSVMKDNDLLEDINEDNKNQIYKAIYLHNKPQLPEDDDNLFYAKLIRDADKLDIWNIYMNKYEMENENNYIINLSHKAEISDDVYNKLLNKELIKYSILKTVNDLKLMQMAWIYDINFKSTFEIISERSYIDTIYNSMKENKKAEKIYSEIKNYMNGKLNN